MTYAETLQYLFEALPMFHRVGPAAYKANLDNTYALCDLLGNPEKGLTCIHVAGTNGKGSVSHMLASVLQAAGHKTGLYTSPHLRDFRERIRVNGTMVSEEWVAGFVTKYQDDFARIQPSFFEMSTAMAFAYFAEVKTDIVVFETGLGGRLDSTNVVTPLVSVITNIGYDHMNLLGDILEKIAGEKAGIIKHAIPAVVGETHPATAPVFEAKAKQENTTLVFADQHYSARYNSYDSAADRQLLTVLKDDQPYLTDLEIDLTGKYQAKNCCTVLQTVELVSSRLGLTEDHIRRGLANVKASTGLTGRWQILQRSPLVVCDTGHNEDGLKEVLPMLESLPKEKLHIVLGMVNDKEIDKVLALFPKEAIYYFCKANIPRGLDANTLQTEARKFGLSGMNYPSVKEALEAAKKNANERDVIFVGGSTFTVAEVV